MIICCLHHPVVYGGELQRYTVGWGLWFTVTLPLERLNLKPNKTKRDTAKCCQRSIWSLHTLLMGMRRGTATSGNQSGSLMELSMHCPYDPIIPLLGVYRKEMKTHGFTKSCMRMFTVAFFVITRNRKQPKSPPTGEWINKPEATQIQTTEYYSASKRKQGYTPQYKFKYITLSQRSQAQKAVTYCRIPRTRHRGKGKLLESESRWVVARDWGRGGIHYERIWGAMELLYSLIAQFHALVKTHRTLCQKG